MDFSWSFHLWKKSVFSTVTSSHAKLCFTLRFITPYYECKRKEIRSVQLFWKSQMWIYCWDSYFLFEQRSFKHFLAFVFMQICACLKEHMTVHCVFCAISMVYPGSAVSWNCQDCNRQSMQRVQMLGHKCSFPKSYFLDSGRKKWQKVLRHWW